MHAWSLSKQQTNVLVGNKIWLKVGWSFKISIRKTISTWTFLILLTCTSYSVHDFILIIDEQIDFKVLQLQNKNRSPDSFHKHFKHTCTSYKIIKHVYQYFNNEIMFHKSHTCVHERYVQICWGFFYKKIPPRIKRHLLLRAIEISFSILDLCLII